MSSGDATTNNQQHGGSLAEPTASLSFAVVTPAGRLEYSGQLPTGRVHPLKLLPHMHQIADRAVELSTRAAAQRGQTVSCRKGCGACCRQLVPISETEALALAELVAVMPEPRQTEIRRRFLEARARLADAGLLEVLARAESRATLPSIEVGLRYFELGIPCPFLEDESCSIHPSRPIACREFLVSSPPANCSRPSADTIVPIPIVLRASEGIRRLPATPRAVHDPAHNNLRRAPWVALVLSLEWAAEHSGSTRTSSTRTGAELLREFVETMIRTAAPLPPG